MNPGELLCARCGKLVEVTREHYEVQEHMHWLCFHLEYEHEGDPDRACADVSCPWWTIEALKDELHRRGVEPDQALDEAIKRKWKS